MVRRPPVRRYPDGVPKDVDRCKAMVPTPIGEQQQMVLEPGLVVYTERPCTRPRQRGRQWCWQHDPERKGP